MYNVFYNILQPSLKDLTLHYMNTDSFVLSYSEGSVDNEHMDLSNLEPPIKTINKVPGKFKHELGSKIFEGFVVLTPKTYNFKNYANRTKEKDVEKHNKAKYKGYYDAVMYNTQRTVQERKIQKIGDSMTTTKTCKISLNTFDDNRFYLNNIESYPHDENLFLFKRDLINKIYQADPSLFKESLEVIINNIKEFTIKEDRKFIEAAIRLYNDINTLVR